MRKRLKDHREKSRQDRGRVSSGKTGGEIGDTAGGEM